MGIHYYFHALNSPRFIHSKNKLFEKALLDWWHEELDGASL